MCCEDLFYGDWACGDNRSAVNSGDFCASDAVK